jgi:23S rRNA (cytosine1962-C5)-methyltransferase
MKILTADFNNQSEPTKPGSAQPGLAQYQLLDSGNGYKLERFGNNIIARPDTNCVWKKLQPESEWNKAAAVYKNAWTFKNNFKEPWTISYSNLKDSGLCKNQINLALRATISKNIGIFPEQSAHWLWFAKLITGAPKQPNVLNLFAYTGAATLCAAAAGAQVCHVDAAKSTVNWARQNQELSGLQKAPIRWIVDDCTKFVMREVKRGVKYDGIIMDPPAFGRDPKGKVFEFEKQVCNLLELCKQILSDKPLFFIFNGYSMGYSATVLKNLLQDYFPKQAPEFGELQIAQVGGKRNLPCSLYARF